MHNCPCFVRVCVGGATMEIKTYKARLIHYGGKTLLHFGRYLDGAALNIELTTPHGTAATSCV